MQQVMTVIEAAKFLCPATTFVERKEIKSLIRKKALKAVKVAGNRKKYLIDSFSVLSYKIKKELLYFFLTDINIREPLQCQLIYDRLEIFLNLLAEKNVDISTLKICQSLSNKIKKNFKKFLQEEYVCNNFQLLWKEIFDTKEKIKNSSQSTFEIIPATETEELMFKQIQNNKSLFFLTLYLSLPLEFQEKFENYFKKDFSIHKVNFWVSQMNSEEIFNFKKFLLTLPFDAISQNFLKKILSNFFN